MAMLARELQEGAKGRNIVVYNHIGCWGNPAVCLVDGDNPLKPRSSGIQ